MKTLPEAHLTSADGERHATVQLCLTPEAPETVHYMRKRRKLNKEAIEKAQRGLDHPPNGAQPAAAGAGSGSGAAAAAAAGGLDSGVEQPWRSDELRREIAAGKQPMEPPSAPSSTDHRARRNAYGPPPRRHAPRAVTEQSPGGTHQATVEQDQTPLEGDETDDARRLRLHRNRNARWAVRCNLAADLSHAGGQEDGAGAAAAGGDEEGPEGDDGAGAAAGGAGDGERHRRGRRGEQQDMRGSLAERLHRAENAFDSLKRRTSTDAYEELRTQHMQKAAENRRQAATAFDSGRGRTAFQKDVAAARRKGQQQQLQREAEAAAGEGADEREQQGDEPRVLEPWASIENFHKELKEIPQATCDVCNERWPGMELCRDGTMCTRCFKDNKDSTKIMSKENNMDPETDITALEEYADEHGVLPELSEVEEALIAKAQVVVTFYRLAHGSTGYRGHTCFLPQNVNSFTRQLPRRVNTLDWLVVRKEGAEPGECCRPPHLRALCLPSIHPSIHLGSVMCMYSRVIC